jgi:AcrR family transcriptional regulator
MSTADRPAAGEAPAGEDGPPLRRDAERNRERIITAARRVFAAGGLDASMASVARAADVGIATLFRRFPTREDLINAVFADTMSAYVGAVTTALADPDPWHGFTAYIHAVCAMQAADRGFAEVLAMTFPAATQLEDQRQRAYRGFLRLIARAKHTGRLRRGPRRLAAPRRLHDPGLHRAPARHPPAAPGPRRAGPRHARPRLRRRPRLTAARPVAGSESGGRPPFLAAPGR